MKTILFILIILSLSLNHLYGQKKAEPLRHRKQTDTRTRNINHPDAHKFQDLKKVSAYIAFVNFNKFRHCSGTLINTVENSKLNGLPKLYFLTADHCRVPIGKWEPSEESEYPIFISFDFEASDPLKIKDTDFTSEEFARITTLWEVDFNPIIQDSESDIALYEIIPNDSDDWTVENSEIFPHVYTIGWSLNYLEPFSTSVNNPNLLNLPKNDVTVIAHPDSDFKKFMNTSKILNYRSGSKPYNVVASDRNMLHFSSENLVTTFLLSGTSSGSSLLNSKGQSTAILSFGTRDFKALENTGNPHTELFSPLANSWYLKSDSDLQTILDPKKTWISNIPGGYLNDLMPIDNTSDFYNLQLNKYEYSRPFSNFRVSEFFNLIFDSHSENLLGNGILLPENTTLEEVDVLTLSLTSNSETLYEAFYDKKSPNSINSGKFKGSRMENGKRYVLKNRYFKRRLMEYFNIPKDIEESQQISMLKGFTLPSGEITLKTTRTGIPVRAIKLPFQMPYNARELFEPGAYDNLWRSKKYPEMRGENSTNLYIDKLKVDLKTYTSAPSHTGDNCIESNYNDIALIKTSNNGGYLNLVNPNYSLNDVIASDPNCTRKNTLKTTITTSEISNNKYYNAWVDYSKTANPVTLIYNLDDAILAHDESTSNPTNSNEIVFHYEIPSENDLNDAFNTSNDIIKARYRVGVANTALAQTISTYTEGEIEDYLMLVRKTTIAERQNLLKTQAKIRAKAKKPVRNKNRNPFAGLITKFKGFRTNRGGLGGGASAPGAATSEADITAYDMQYPLGTATLIEQGIDITDGYLLTGYFENLGTAEGIFMPFMQQIQTLFNQAYRGLSTEEVTNPLGNDAVVKPADLNPQNFDLENNPLNPDSPLNFGNPANDGNPLTLDIPLTAPANNPFGVPSTNILDTPENASLFYQVYDNIIRITNSIYDPNAITYYQSSHYSQLPADYWWIHNSFMTALNLYQTGAKVYNHKVLLDSIIREINEQGIEYTLQNPRFMISKVLHFLYLNPLLIVAALPAGQPAIVGQQVLYYVYNYFIPFYVTMRNMSWFIEQFNNQLNLMANNAKVALDYLGALIPQGYKERTILSYQTFGAYPTANNLGVIYHAKGTSNQVLLAIDHNGYLVYRLKIGSANWQEVKSDTQIPLNQEVLVGLRFDNGTISLYLNEQKIATVSVTNSQITGFSDFTKLNNGSRWGGPLDVFDTSNDTSNLKSLDASLTEFLLYDEALTDDAITLLGNVVEQSFNISSKSAPTTGKAPINTNIEVQEEELNEPDFAIYPNPAKDHINILVEIREAGPLDLGIYDQTGRRVYHIERKNINQGHQLITLALQDLSSGTYILKLRAGDVSRSEQVVVSN